MSLRISREVLQVHSALGEKFPLVVSAPQEPEPGRKHPVVLVLHDTLATASPSEFVESALQIAHSFFAPMAHLPSFVLAQAFGGGNPGWIGWGSLRCFEVIEYLKTCYACDENRISLLGIGAGATGALLLAEWFPDLFSAVASFGAWTDPSVTLPLGQEDWPKWERPQRKALNPLALTRNLAGLHVYCGHPWWFDGTNGTPGSEHREALIAKLKREQISNQLEPDLAGLAIRNKEMIRRPKETLEWLISQSRPSSLATIRFRTYTLRAPGSNGIQIRSILRPIDGASFEAQIDASVAKIETAGLSSLSIEPQRILPSSESALMIDGQTLEIKRELRTAKRLVFEKWDKRWQILADREDEIRSDPEAGLMEKQTGLSGPILDLWWAPIAIVYGTLGDDLENATLQNCALGVRARFVEGRDSLNPYPGSRKVHFDIPICKDTEATEQLSRSHNLILIGRPTSNLVMARCAGRLPCTWDLQREEEETSAETVAFEIAGKRYEHPRDAVCFISPNPSASNRYVCVLSGTTIEAVRDVSLQPMSHFPDYVVMRKNEMLDWGYFDRTWSLNL